MRFLGILFFVGAVWLGLSRGATATVRRALDAKAAPLPVTPFKIPDMSAVSLEMHRFDSFELTGPFAKKAASPKLGKAVDPARRAVRDN